MQCHEIVQLLSVTENHNTSHTHTHPFNGPFSGTTRMSRYQKGKTNLNFTEARDSEWQWHQLGICKSPPCSRQITTPAPDHSVFYRLDALPAAQPTASKHWRHCTTVHNMWKLLLARPLHLQPLSPVLWVQSYPLLLRSRCLRLICRNSRQWVPWLVGWSRV